MRNREIENERHEDDDYDEERCRRLRYIIHFVSPSPLFSSSF